MAQFMQYPSQAVRVQLDKPYAHFTNLDLITGRVILDLPTRDTIAAITVKLEGESSTRVRPGVDDMDSQSEVHKLLYRVESVFPPSGLQQVGSSDNYTLSPGHYEYPFKFKIPFNNDCEKNSHGLQGLIPTLHVHKTLPPSLDYGNAGIRYYVKVTVARASILKQNFRASTNFLFLPIEPPRPPDGRQEAYARRSQQFQDSSGSWSKGIFAKKSRPESGTAPAQFCPEIRLPNPPILTCNETIPLRVLLTKVNESTEILYLQSLQIELIGFTTLRAQQLAREEMGSWVLFSKSNLNIPIQTPTPNKATVIDNSMWKSIRLPTTVAPSFMACNVSRRYSLDVRIGIGRGLPGGAILPDYIVSPLRMDVEVYSGIAPPPALLEAMATSTYLPQTLPSFSNGVPPRRPVGAGSSRPSYQESVQLPAYDEAPPSYEDAIAEDVAPVDGPRRTYTGNLQPEQTPRSSPTPVGSERPVRNA
ncbi:MAG: hypothetical protein M1834_004650 [Cirrosporium novae-zelandiae]|nr:MAG: hypothetical protein M1834_004650 [Cirrosporium novae-zelandiae]